MLSNRVKTIFEKRIIESKKVFFSLFLSLFFFFFYLSGDQNDKSIYSIHINESPSTNIGSQLNVICFEMKFLNGDFSQNIEIWIFGMILTDNY